MGYILVKKWTDSKDYILICLVLLQADEANYYFMNSILRTATVADF